MPTNRKTETISFRLPLELVEKLDELSELNRTSKSAWVRRAIEERLTDPITGQSLMRKLIRIDDNQAKVLFYVLTQIGGMSPTDASDLVRSKLGRK